MTSVTEEPHISIYPELQEFWLYLSVPDKQDKEFAPSCSYVHILYIYIALAIKMAVFLEEVSG